jgi:hypothetical protein
MGPRRHRCFSTDHLPARPVTHPEPLPKRTHFVDLAGTGSGAFQRPYWRVSATAHMVVGMETRVWACGKSGATTDRAWQRNQPSEWIHWKHLVAL